MNDVQKRAAAKHFAEYWKGKGYEKGESQKYWLALLGEVFGLEHAGEHIFFEDRVHIDHTSFIDGYIPETHVLIEQKSIDKGLNDRIEQSDGTYLTPREQAQRYVHALLDTQGRDAVPKWVVICNFAKFHVYDMDHPQNDPLEIKLEDLPTQYYLLEFLVRKEDITLQQEMEISIQAGEIVGQLYDALLKEYKDPTNEHSLKSLNELCVRLVFCLYAEDAGIFGKRLMFHDYMQHNGQNKARQALINLFMVLDTPVENRDPYMDDELAAFPYVNGGLFSNENIEIPRINQTIYDLLLNKASAAFDWSDISPTIFGAVFESTLNPETRRKGGMHYTSIENIHKVIDPLFLDDLKRELEEIKQSPTAAGVRTKKMQAFQLKLASLKFFDPACGSGNFLTETYLSIRRLENEVIRYLKKQSEGQIAFAFMTNDSIGVKVSIKQFYGIEINDFAVSVAKTALWIAEAQMLCQTKNSTDIDDEFLPLTTIANIHRENALRIDWNDIIPAQELDYIMRNPPFVGKKEQSKEQKAELTALFGPKERGVGNLDYVSGWYMKAMQMLCQSKIRAAFVSTNSITQGEQVPILWKHLLSQGVHIDFAYQTFRWDSEASLKAHVHCVIIGFSVADNPQPRKLFLDQQIKLVQNINPYLVDAPTILIESRSKSVSGALPISYGSMPIDDGHLILSEEDVAELLSENLENKRYIREYIGGAELIQGKKRWCLWLVGASPKEIRQSKFISERVRQTAEFRKSSDRPQTLALAEMPTLFGEIRQPDSKMLVIPKVSSERRRYIPIAYISPETIVNGSALIVPNATLYHFGVLSSNVHNAWMRAVAGRMKSDYQYSNTIVYNNFPWPTPTDKQKAQIEQTAQAILDARALSPDSSLADLYGEYIRSPALRTAHQNNNRAVWEAYGKAWNIGKENDCVAYLMQLYQSLITTEDKKK